MWLHQNSQAIKQLNNQYLSSKYWNWWGGWGETHINLFVLESSDIKDFQTQTVLFFWRCLRDSSRNSNEVS